MTRRHSEASIQGVILPPSIGAPRSHPIPWAFKARTRNLVIQVFPRNGAQGELACLSVFLVQKRSCIVPF